MNCRNNVWGLTKKLGESDITQLLELNHLVLSALLKPINK